MLHDYLQNYLTFLSQSQTTRDPVGRPDLWRGGAGVVPPPLPEHKTRHGGAANEGGASLWVFVHR